MQSQSPCRCLGGNLSVQLVNQSIPSILEIPLSCRQDTHTIAEVFLHGTAILGACGGEVSIGVSGRVCIGGSHIRRRSIKSRGEKRLGVLLLLLLLLYR